MGIHHLVQKCLFFKCYSFLHTFIYASLLFYFEPQPLCSERNRNDEISSQKHTTFRDLSKYSYKLPSKTLSLALA